MGHICYMQHQGALRIATRLPISVGKVPVRPQAVTEKLAVEVLGQQNQKQNVTIVVVTHPMSIRFQSQSE